MDSIAGRKNGNVRSLLNYTGEKTKTVGRENTALNCRIDFGLANAETWKRLLASFFQLDRAPRHAIDEDKAAQRKYDGQTPPSQSDT